MLRKAGKHALIAAVSLVLGFVAGFVGAFASWRFWGWFEDKTGIESLGHGGPDDWVFEFMICLCVLVVFAVLEWTFRSQKPLDDQPG